MSNDDKFIKTIQFYTTLGYNVMPLKGKVPIIKNWRNYKVPVDRIQSVFREYTSAGFIIPNNIVVVDIDPRNFKDGDSLSKLNKTIGCDLYNESRFVVNTANGGKHFYFLLPDTKLRLPNSLHGFEGVEFKTEGKQVVIPNSTIEGGKVYTVQKEKLDLKNLSMIPNKLLELFLHTDSYTEPAVHKQKHDTHFDNEPADIEMVKKKLQNISGAVEGANGDYHTFKVACLGREYGLSFDVFFPLMLDWNEKCLPPWDVEDLKVKVKNAYSYGSSGVGTKNVNYYFGEGAYGCEQILSEEKSDEQYNSMVSWRDGLDKNVNGTLKKTFNNTRLMLENIEPFKGNLKLNLFTNSIVWYKPMHWHYDLRNKKETKSIRWNRDYDSPMVRKILNDNGLDASSDTIHDAVVCIAIQSRFHPVREYFESLESWDGKERLLDFFSTYCNTESNEYTRLVARNLFLAIINRVFNPGSKFDFMVILTGEQGIGKSSLIEVMALKEEWFCDNIGDISNKDVILQTEGKLIIEWPELNMFSKTDINTVKSFLSRRIDRARNAFEKSAKDNPRQYVIVGTSNQVNFLSDETGSRRIWPIEVKGFIPTESGKQVVDLESLMQDIKQIYAEAFHLFKSHDKLDLSLGNKTAEDILTKEHERCYNADDWEEQISQWLIKDAQVAKAESTGIRGLNIWEDLFKEDVIKFDLKAQRRIGRIMRRLGYTHVSLNKIKVYKKY